MKRKEKEALGLTPPKVSKYAAKRAAKRANPDSPFAGLAYVLQVGPGEGKSRVEP